MWCDGHVVGLSAGVHVPCVCNSSMSGGAAGGDSHGRVHVVGNVPACVPGGGDAKLADLQIGVEDAGRYVVLIKQLVRTYARLVGTAAANIALQSGGASLARRLGHGTPFKLQRGARAASARAM